MRSTCAASGALSGAFMATVLAAGGGLEIIETFADDTFPQFGRTADAGWTNEVVDGRLLITKADGIGGFSAARLLLCDETLEGDFVAQVHARREAAGVGSLGIVVSQQVPGWVSFSDIFLNSAGQVAALCGTHGMSTASAPAPFDEVTLRITRAGDTLTLAYDGGTGFVDLLDGTSSLFTAPMVVSLFHLEESGFDARAGSFDDFTIQADAFGLRGADIAWNGAVDTADLLALLANWGPCPPDPYGGCCTPDLDHDGTVGINDLLMLLVAWD